MIFILPYLLSASLRAPQTPAPQPAPPSEPPVATATAPTTATAGNAEPAASPEKPAAPEKSGKSKTATPPAAPSGKAKAAPSTVAKPAASGQLSLAASTQKKILVVRLGGSDVKTYAIAVGTQQKPTPMGRFSIRHIVWNPAWHPPAEKWAKGKKPTAPGDPKNPMKVVKIFFQEPDYYIHGTDKDDSLGSAASHGCLRMAQSEVYELARYLMENGGAPREEAWYAQAMNGDKPAEVRLPKGIPIVIGK